VKRARLPERCWSPRGRTGLLGDGAVLVGAARRGAGHGGQWEGGGALLPRWRFRSRSLCVDRVRSGNYLVCDRDRCLSHVRYLDASNK
jgi:hypothetical protein